MKRNALLLISCIVVFFYACGGDDSPTDTSNQPPGNTNESPGDTSSGDLLSLNFLAENNAFPINADVQISGSSIKTFFPPKTDLTAVVPSFTLSEGASLKVNGFSISSGVSEIDISDGATFEVVASGGATTNFSLTALSDFEEIDNAIQSLRGRYNAPGMQIAIIKNERLVYANSYGKADVSGAEDLRNNHRFRIASISKPITAAAILKLIADNQLMASTKVFGTNGILGTDYGTPPYEANKESITVWHLINHTSGWTNNPFDPMFNNINWGYQELISDMLDNRPLETPPGASYYYSNFGYCVLGRIIEEVSGMSYEDYVVQNILQPGGMTTMTSAGNTLEEKKENEVEYLGQEGFSPYAMNVMRMDSHGGWIATATDLARFMTLIDRNTNVPDIVSGSAFNSLYFGFDNWWFSGSLPGTSTVVSRLNNEYSFVILSNTRKVPIDAILQDMNTTMTELILARNEWPGYDLFDGQ